MLTEKDIYAALGELSVKFSNLEFGMTSILEMLIDSSNRAIGAISTSKKNLSQKTELIKELIPFRFPANSETATKILTLVSEVGLVRTNRNRFIHDLWKIDEAGLQANMITCYELKLNSPQNNNVINGLREHKFTFEELVSCSEKVGELVARSFMFAKELGATNLDVEN